MENYQSRITAFIAGGIFMACAAAALGSSWVMLRAALALTVLLGIHLCIRDKESDEWSDE